MKIQISSIGSSFGRPGGETAKPEMRKTIEDLVYRVKGITEGEFNILTVTVIKPTGLRGRERGAFYSTPLKEIGITTNATEYDFYHELGHFFEHLRYGAKFGIWHAIDYCKTREDFANRFMRTWGRPRVRVFKNGRRSYEVQKETSCG